ncbi:hypothetical protein D3C80_1735950 [compost metagenome]
MAVAIHAAALVGIECGAIGVENARVFIERRSLAGQSHFDGLFRLHGPVVIEVQIRDFAGHQRRVGQA